jgi:hypothetical protein
MNSLEFVKRGKSGSWVTVFRVRLMRFEDDLGLKMNGSESILDWKRFLALILVI